MARAFGWLRPLVLLTTLASCHKRSHQTEPPAAHDEPSPTPTRLATASVAPQATVDDLPIDADLMAFVVRGRVRGVPPMVFIPGMCVHPRDYVATFREAAAARGTLIAVQGDVSCGGDGYARRWSSDLAAMDRRIGAAFAAADLGPPEHAVIIGYSQGAERAERLVARYPGKYGAALLMASPIVPSAEHLRGLRAVALLAGTLDDVRNMQAAVAPLHRAGIGARFFAIPGARHGQMGNEPERTMGAALDFVSEPIRGSVR